MTKELIEMMPGKIYYIDYGGTQVIGRYKSSDTCNHYLFEELHYWAGFEAFHKEPYCVKAGIQSIRDASAAEKHNLLRFAIEHQTI